MDQSSAAGQDSGLSKIVEEQDSACWLCVFIAVQICSRHSAVREKVQTNSELSL